MNLSSLQQELGFRGRVLADSAEEEFQQYLVRWSEIGKQVPGAIAIVKDETDAQKAVRNHVHILFTIKD